MSLEEGRSYKYLKNDLRKQFNLYPALFLKNPRGVLKSLIHVYRLIRALHIFFYTFPPHRVVPEVQENLF